MITILSIVLGFNIGVILILIAGLKNNYKLISIYKDRIKSMEKRFDTLKETMLLPDNYPVFKNYMYNCDGKKIKSEISGDVLLLKKHLRKKGLQANAITKYKFK